MKITRTAVQSALCFAIGWTGGLAGGAQAAPTPAATTAPVATVYYVGIEYCNGKGQLDRYDTIRTGVRAYKLRILHGATAHGSYSHVAIDRKVGSRPTFEVDHTDFPCPPK